MSGKISRDLSKYDKLVRDTVDEVEGRLVDEDEFERDLELCLDSYKKHRYLVSQPCTAVKNYLTGKGFEFIYLIYHNSLRIYVFKK